MLKCFEVMVNIFEFSHVKEIVESWLVVMNHLFLDRENKTKAVPASFSYFTELFWEKSKFSSKSVIVTTIISLHYKETNEAVLLNCSCIKVVPKSNSQMASKLGNIDNQTTAKLFRCNCQVSARFILVVDMFL